MCSVANSFGLKYAKYMQVMRVPWTAKMSVGIILFNPSYFVFHSIFLNSSILFFMPIVHKD